MIQAIKTHLLRATAHLELYKRVSITIYLSKRSELKSKEKFEQIWLSFTTHTAFVSESAKITQNHNKTPRFRTCA